MFPNEATVDDAIHAVKQARMFLPQWRSLARVLTKNPKMKVEFGPIPCTDGDTIFIQVPLELANRNQPEHNKSVCGMRDDIDVLRCPACAFRERTLIIMIHEISHIVQGSFSALHSQDTLEVVARSIALRDLDDGDEKAERIRSKIMKALGDEREPITSYMGLGGLVSPYFPQLLNAVEDMRVNRQTMIARPGTVLMFRALYEDILRNGIKTPDGKTLLYKDLPANSQAMLIVMCRVMDFDHYAEFFDPNIVETLLDDELEEAIVATKEQTSVRGMYLATFPILKACQRLGFFLEDESENEEDDQEKGDGEGEGQPDNMGTPEEVEAAVNSFGDHPDGQPGSKDPDEGQPKEGKLGPSKENELKQAIEIVLKQMDHFDKVSRNIDGVDFVTRKSDPNMESDAWGEYEDLQVPEQYLAPALSHLRAVFAENKARRKVRNLKKGRLATRTLATRAPLEDDRLFQKRLVPAKRGHFILLGLDVSGSTAGRLGTYYDRNAMRRITLIKEVGLAFAELLSRLGVDFALYAHSGSFYYRYEADMKVSIVEVKGVHDRWTAIEKDRLHRLKPYSANLDGHTLEFYRKRAQESDATTKTILYLTDGDMPMENYDEELEILQREISLCRKLGIGLAGVGVNTTAPTQHGLETIEVNSVEDITHVVKALRRILAG
jgi:hypothetical protein